MEKFRKERVTSLINRDTLLKYSKKINRSSVVNTALLGESRHREIEILYYWIREAPVVSSRLYTPRCHFRIIHAFCATLILRAVRVLVFLFVFLIIW